MLIALAVAVPAAATVMVEVQLEDMVRDSVGVVRARVVATGVQMQMREGTYEPTTITTLQVDEWLAAPPEGALPQQLRLRELGGEDAHGGGMRIAGTPTYAVGEEVIVVLDRDADGFSEYRRTYGLVQGKFVIRRGVPGAPDVVARDAGAVGFAAWRDGQMVIEHGGQLVVQLDGFVRRIREIAAMDGRDVPSTDGVQGGVNR